MDLFAKIQDFVALQKDLIAALKDTLGNQDWALLVGVPKQGLVKLGDDEWSYHRHGSGIRFERNGLVVDANRHLDQDPGLFDLGRLVAFLESEGDHVVSFRGKPIQFDFTSGGELLNELARGGHIRPVSGLSGQLFQVCDV